VWQKLLKCKKVGNQLLSVPGARTTKSMIEWGANGPEEDSSFAL